MFATNVNVASVETKMGFHSILIASKNGCGTIKHNFENYKIQYIKRNTDIIVLLCIESTETKIFTNVVKRYHFFSHD